MEPIPRPGCLHRMRPFSFRSGTSGLLRVLKGIGIVLAALLALLVLTGAAFAVFGGNWLRGPVERAALENTGRVLKLGGDVDIGFTWPPQLRVQAADVAFANADWGKQPQLLTADEVDLALSLPPLLLGRVVVNQARLRNAVVSLEKDAQGRKNWELPGEPGKLKIERLALDNGRIDYDEPAQDTSVQAQISTAPGGLSFSAQGKYAGRKLEARGNGGPLLALREQSEPYPFDIDATVGPTRAKAQGSVTGLAELTALDARIQASGETLDELFPLIGVALPHTPRYRTAGRIVHEGSVWRYEQFTARVGGSDVSGTVRVDVSGKRPDMTGEATFGTLDFKDLGATIGTDEERDRVLPVMRFDASRWDSIDADVRMSARKIVRPGDLPLEHFAARLRMRDAVLSLDPLEFGIAGGKLSGTVRLDGREKDIRARATIRIVNVALDRLIPGFDTSRIDAGRIDGAVDLSGRGNSVAEMLGNADGTVAALVDGGHASRLLLEQIGLHLPRIAALAVTGDERVPIRCGAVDFKMERGVLHANTALLDTTVTTVQGGGTINLRDETLDFTLTERPKETSLFSLKSPIHVRGSIADPDIGVEAGGIAARGLGAAALAIANPLLALLPMIEAGPGADSNCGRLLNESEAAGNAKKTPAKPAPRSR